MLKKLERYLPTSCWNKAGEDEMVFVMLGHDVAAPDGIRAWAEARVRKGKNKWEDEQIREALRCADEIERVNRQNGLEGS